MMNETMMKDEVKTLKEEVDRKIGILDRQWDKVTSESKEFLGTAKDSLRSIQGRLGQAMERAEDMTQEEWNKFKNESNNLLEDINKKMKHMEIK